MSNRSISAIELIIVIRGSLRVNLVRMNNPKSDGQTQMLRGILTRRELITQREQVDLMTPL
jgi:hypothetical protein